MNSPYSRLQRRYERKTQQKIVLSLIGSLALLIVLVLFGLPTLLNLTATISSVRRAPSRATAVKGLVPTAPQLFQDLAATSSATVKIRGVADPKVTVEIFQNDRSLGTTVAGDDGIFKMDVDLEKGQNIFLAQAVGDQGQKSDPSPAYYLSYFTGQPKLEAEVSGSTINGKTDPGNSVTVNDRLAIVKSDGSFNFTVELTGGENKFKVTATDPAGNSTSKELTATKAIP